MLLCIKNNRLKRRYYPIEEIELYIKEVESSILRIVIYELNIGEIEQQNNRCILLVSILSKK